VPGHRRRSRTRPPLGALVALLGAASALAALAASCAAPASTGITSDLAGPPPFADGERLRYSLHADDGRVIGDGEFTVRHDGAALVLEQRYVEREPAAGTAPTTDVISVRVDGATLKPLLGSREVDERRDDGRRARRSYAWRYADDAEGRPVLIAQRTLDGKHDERTLRLREHHYDNESALWLWRTLAFAEGYEERYVSANAIERSQQTVAVRLPQRETITVPAGTFETWRLLVRTGRAVRTAWIHASPPHEIVQWDNGSIVFRLEPRGPASAGGGR